MPGARGPDPNAHGHSRAHLQVQDSLNTKLAHKTSTTSVEKEKYVGDIISSDGKLTKNITSRYAKATGITSQILLMLNEVSLGYHYFSIGMIYRNLLFISSVLVNSEVWYPINERDIKVLINADKTLLKKIYGLPQCTPICLMFLDSGELPLENILKSRRINYLYYLLTALQMKC